MQSVLSVIVVSKSPCGRLETTSIVIDINGLPTNSKGVAFLTTAYTLEFATLVNPNGNPPGIFNGYKAKDIDQTKGGHTFFPTSMKDEHVLEQFASAFENTTSNSIPAYPGQIGKEAVSESGITIGWYQNTATSKIETFFPRK
jgi:hypothetical protein